MTIQDMLRQWSSSELHEGHKHTGELAAKHIDKLSNKIEELKREIEELNNEIYTR